MDFSINWNQEVIQKNREIYIIRTFQKFLRNETTPFICTLTIF